MFVTVSNDSLVTLSTASRLLEKGIVWDECQFAGKEPWVAMVCYCCRAHVRVGRGGLDFLQVPSGWLHQFTIAIGVFTKHT